MKKPGPHQFTLLTEGEPVLFIPRNEEPGYLGKIARAYSIHFPLIQFKDTRDLYMNGGNLETHDTDSAVDSYVFHRHPLRNPDTRPMRFGEREIRQYLKQRGCSPGAVDTFFSTLSD